MSDEHGDPYGIGILEDRIKELKRELGEKADWLKRIQESWRGDHTQLCTEKAELEKQLEEARDDIRKLNWYTPEEHIRRALAPMFAEFLDVQQQADDTETFAKCDSATTRSQSLLQIILHMALDGANDYIARLSIDKADWDAKLDSMERKSNEAILQLRAERDALRELLESETGAATKYAAENEEARLVLEMFHDAVVYTNLSKQKPFDEDDVPFLKTQIRDIETRYGVDEPDQLMKTAMTKAVRLVIYDKDGNKRTQAQRGGNDG